MTPPLTPVAPPWARHAVCYDRTRQRLWILGQRCHHGATGAVLAGLAAGGVLAARLTGKNTVALSAAAGLLMAHDWKDRAVWFERGAGTQL